MNQSPRSRTFRLALIPLFSLLALVASVAASLVTLSLTACGGGGSDDGSGSGGATARGRAARIAAGEAIVNTGGDPRSLDPNLATDTMSMHAITQFVRGLTSLGNDGTIHPEIAERWEISADGRTYDFFLRDARWDDGEPVLASDFVFAWLDRMLDPKFEAEYAYMLFHIEGAEAYYTAKENRAELRAAVGVEAVDARRLRVRLVNAAPFFLELVAHQSHFAVPEKHVRANPKWSMKAETYVGNGPFKMTEYVSGDRIVGVKGPSYWNAGTVSLNRIELRFIEEESTARLAFEAGDLDAITLAPRSDLEALKKTPWLKFAPLVGTYFLNFNMQSPTFRDPRVRRALALAIDRQSIIEHVTQCGERPALSLVPPELYGGEARPSLRDNDVAEAKRLMAEAGFPDGKGFPKLVYIYNTLEVHKSVAQVVQENWRLNLGVEMIASNQEFKTLIEKRRAADFDIARNGWIADYADPINFLELFLSDSGNNDSHWKDPEFDSLVEAARVESDPAKRLELLHRAEDRFMSELPVVPLYFYSNPYLVAEELEGFVINRRDEFDAGAMSWKTGG